MPASVPWEIARTLRPGTVYYFQHRDLTSAEPHYLIVVNSHPLRDELLLLAVASSKIDRVRARRRGLPPETLVEVSTTDYDEFSTQSIVDCNRVFRKALAELVQEWPEIRRHPKKDMPARILIVIQQGVKASPLVERETKLLID